MGHWALALCFLRITEVVVSLCLLQGVEGVGSCTGACLRAIRTSVQGPCHGEQLQAGLREIKKKKKKETLLIALNCYKRIHHLLSICTTHLSSNSMKPVNGSTEIFILPIGGGPLKVSCRRNQPSYQLFVPQTKRI
ncbi:hypothetical protein BDZ91DRAFT_831491 [Kalaharituber pfeilii]|nr:hypothetical protein BDZ91DRAFT_831491 [Kalaharituber pfeilii]